MHCRDKTRCCRRWINPGRGMRITKRTRSVVSQLVWPSESGESDCSLTCSSHYQSRSFLLWTPVKHPDDCRVSRDDLDVSLFVWSVVFGEERLVWNIFAIDI